MHEITFEKLSKKIKNSCDTYLIETQEPLNIYFLSQLLGNDSKIFRFLMKHSDIDERFSELARYVSELDEASGREGVFKGYAVIELTEWINDVYSDYLDAFIAYLYDHSKYINYIFVVDSKGNNHSDRLSGKLTEYFNIESYKINLYDKNFISEYISNYFSKIDITIKSTVSDKISHKITELSENPDFSFSRISLICDALINFARTENKKSVTELMLKNFIKSEKFKSYTKKLSENKKENICGFSLGN